VKVDPGRIAVQSVSNLGPIGRWKLGMLLGMPCREFHAVTTTPLRAWMPL